MAEGGLDALRRMHYFLKAVYCPSFYRTKLSARPTQERTQEPAPLTIRHSVFLAFFQTARLERALALLEIKGYFRSYFNFGYIN
jgi:hypothetical protein